MNRVKGPENGSGQTHRPSKRWKLRTVVRTVAVTVMSGLLLVTAGGLALIYSGFYNLSATEPHAAIVRWALSTMQLRSVEFHARGIEARELADPALVRRGVALYGELCVDCHGAPAVEPAIGRGMNPAPPRLALAAPDYSDAELYWVIRNGFKMAGMPGFEVGRTDDDLWALAAFVRRLPTLTVDDYQAMLAALDGTGAGDAVAWTDTGDHGLAAMRATADPERGRELLEAFGCGSCHRIPGLARATGMAGPPLEFWSDRHYIAGRLLNNPDNLVRWLMDPRVVDPGTVMPDLGVDSTQALHMAAYLFTSGEGLPPSVAIDRPKATRDQPAQPEP